MPLHLREAECGALCKQHTGVLASECAWFSLLVHGFFLVIHTTEFLNFFSLSFFF